MAYLLQDKYINLLTDFGFKRVFGTEPTKNLLIDFLNTLLPEHHRIKDVTFKNNENLGNNYLDRKAIFDIYCQGESGEYFIVEIQKAKQNFFKYRSIYYSTFPIQEQAEKGDWNYKLTPVYTVGVLDFIFAEHKHEENTILHTVELKNQHCEVFYDKLKFIYIELPKFTKTLEELESQFDKWLFLLRHLSELKNPPQLLQAEIFNQLFTVAEIANFSPRERDSYENSLKYYRDLNNVVDTSRQEGREEGLQEGLLQGREEGRQEEKMLNLKRQQALLIRQLSRKLGKIPDTEKTSIHQLSDQALENLGEALFDFSSVDDLTLWLQQNLHREIS